MTRPRWLLALLILMSLTSLMGLAPALYAETDTNATVLTLTDEKIATAVGLSPPVIDNSLAQDTWRWSWTIGTVLDTSRLPECIEASAIDDSYFYERGDADLVRRQYHYPQLC